MTAQGGRVIYRRLLGYLGRRKWIFMLSVFAVALDAAGQGLFFYLLRPLIDETIATPQPVLSLWLPGLVMLAVVVRVLGNFGGVYGMEWVGRGLIADLRSELFERYLSLPSSHFAGDSSGQMISRVTYNTEQVAQAATTALIGSLRDVFTVVALVTVMLLQSWQLTLTMLLLIPVIALIVTVISRRMRELAARIQDSMGEVTRVTEEAVGAQEVVKVFGGQARERQAFGRVNEANRRLYLRLIATQLVSSSLIQLASGLAVIGLLAMIASPWLRDEVTAGIFMSVLAAMVATIPPLKRLTRMHVVIERGVAAADSIFEILDTPPEVDEGQQASTRVHGHVRFLQVSFRYPDQDQAVLDRIDLDLTPGSVTALVGRSGSGKSTLLRLLPRFYWPSDGRITIDGVDLGDFRLLDLRRQIAMVGQEVRLFNDTVAGNIAYGSAATVSQARLREVAEQAHALDFIEALPLGFETPIGENGARLSGGQRQRLAIARALYKDAPILLLDEATSALDSESEQKIQQALDVLMQNRTTLVVAHRLSTVHRADRVVVLDQGRVVEAGTHGQLLASADGLYRHLYELQFQELS